MGKYKLADKIDLKSHSELKTMQEGGAILSEVMDLVLSEVNVGVEVLDLDSLAEKEIRKRGGESSFKKVPGYNWTICACINDVVVHGIPTRYKINENDLVGIDMGVYYKGFHTDSSWSIRAGRKIDRKSHEIDLFLEAGKEALKRAIKQVKVGNYIYDVSKAIEDSVKGSGFSVVRSLIGHGVGRQLHEAPEVPGIASGKREDSQKIQEGLTIAVEVIYNQGTPEVVYDRGDGWTISTKDGKLSGLFESTVAATDHGVILLSKNYGPSGDN